MNNCYKQLQHKENAQGLLCRPLYDAQKIDQELFPIKLIKMELEPNKNDKCIIQDTFEKSFYNTQ